MITSRHQTFGGKIFMCIYTSKGNLMFVIRLTVLIKITIYKSITEDHL